MRDVREVVWGGVLAVLLFCPGVAGGGEPIFAADFADWTSGDLPPGWDLETGATLGSSGPASEVLRGNDRRGKGACLVLRGDGKTIRWWNVQGPLVSVVAGTEVRLSSWLRTKDVRPEGAQPMNCNLLLRFYDAGGGMAPVGSDRFLITRALFGDQEWTRLSRRAVVPPGAVRARVSCFLSCSGRAEFDDILLEAADPLPWKVVEVGRYRYHFLPPDSLPVPVRDGNVAFLGELEKTVGLKLSGHVDYWKYPDLATKAEVTGIWGNAHVERNVQAIHSIWPGDRHEIVHLLLRQLGDPPAILGEGIAVYFSGEWQGKDVAGAVQERRAAGRAVSVDRILATRQFRSYDDDVTYPTSGLFVLRLREKFGIPKLLEFFAAASGREDPKEFREVMRKVLDTTPEDVMREEGD